MREEYRIRRDLMVEALQRIDSLSLAVPDGAFYAFPRYDIPMPAVDVVAHLRARGLAVRPGSEFGPAGEHHLRLSFAADRDSITTGIERLRTGLAELTHVEETSA
jgi:aspartate aminotransferase